MQCPVAAPHTWQKLGTVQFAAQEDKIPSLPLEAWLEEIEKERLQLDTGKHTSNPS
jgi:hypothetical protein